MDKTLFVHILFFLMFYSILFMSCLVSHFSLFSPFTSFHFSFFSSTSSFSFLLLEGVCEVGGTLADGGAALVIADIPGLVEGAHMVRLRPQ
jgi:hypothetical protein